MNNQVIQVLIKRLEKAFELTYDLYNSLSEADLRLNIKNYPSNTMGEQVWCICGARESYLKAIKNSKWGGFSCSLKDTEKKLLVIEKLKETSKRFIEFLQQNTLAIEQVELGFELLEHEIQHQGQLIRYVYANKLAFPKSWNKRYTVG